MKALLLKAVEALKDLDGCYCSARDEMSRAERDYARKVLIAARSAIADLEAAIREQDSGGVPWCHCASHGEPRCAEQCRECAEVDAVAPLKDEGEARALTDDEIAALWIYRKNIHGGELMPQLIDFARAVLSGKAQP